jgi:hypothetical protein
MTHHSFQIGGRQASPVRREITGKRGRKTGCFLFTG